MKSYEIAIALKTSLSEAEQKAIINETKEMIAADGKVVAEQSLGRKALAYPIGHESNGVFYVLRFEAAASVPQALNTKLRINESILRYLLEQREPEVVKKPEK